MYQYVFDKVNMVIIIMDGVFNCFLDDYQKVVWKYFDKGVIFFVVGIQDCKFDEEKMIEVVLFGKGCYIFIDKFVDVWICFIDEIWLVVYCGI